MGGGGEERVAFNQAHGSCELEVVESAAISAGRSTGRRPGEDLKEVESLWGWERSAQVARRGNVEGERVLLGNLEGGTWK